MTRQKVEDVELRSRVIAVLHQFIADRKTEEATHVTSCRCYTKATDRIMRLIAQEKKVKN